ncbi:sulfite exporter TauE/SafE family protein [Rhodobacteraceae bacterium KMM 6894]|nr:sulfite exporter TauE/SafE family protein [Rhodobacteraceae bacterium KMM 6894]
MLELVLICIAGFAAGVLNAVAGGGTFLTLPALIWLGIPPVAANATATLTALPGYVASAWAFRHDLRAQGTLALPWVMIASVIGALTGAALLILTSDRTFSGIIPWLMLLATGLFAVGPALTRHLRARGVPAAGPVLCFVVFVVVAIYGGYFNGGLGIMLLAAMGLLGYSNLHAMNGLKNVLSAVLSLTSAVAFVASGLIVWSAAVPMALSAALGGYIGARLSKKVPNQDDLRSFITLVGLTMTILFFLN